jgi:tetratricopeptide (TPR) repeat protein
MWLGAVAALVTATPAAAGEELLFGPAPAWVETHALEVPGGTQTGQPVRVLQLDNQVLMEGGKRTVYTAVALQLQTPEGLSAGNLSLPWRPETDALTVHKVRIRRGDEVIDVLESGQTFTTLRREQNLEQAMLDGVLTANLIPEDLQVGDILEVAYSVESENPVFGDHDEAIVGPLNAPIDHAYARLLWPESETMRLARTPGMPDWKRSKSGGFEIAQIALEDVQTVPPPEGAPARFGFIGFVEASDYASWSQVSAHFAPIYAEAAKVPATGPLRNEVERIRAASSDPVARAEAALALVQGRVRYVALAMGIGGWVPAGAAQTWSRRYGDCKGKTALLLAILGELGIEAEPVAVNSVLGDAIPERLPMIGMFDHVLVRASIAGRDYWLDGTRTGDTSLARLEVPDFDWGLPITDPGAELVRMKPVPLDKPSEDLAIELDGRKGLRAPVPARLELILRGDSALGTSRLLAGLVGDERDRALREFWRNRYDFIEPDKVGQAFDEATGELTLTLEGRATLEWNGQFYETDGTSVGYRADFTREPGPAEDAPFLVAYPYFDRTRETILLPPDAGFPATASSPDAEVDETVAGIEYRRHASLESNVFTVERTERSVVPEFAAKDAPAFEKRLRELLDKRVSLRMPSNYRPTEADLAVLTTSEGGSANDLVAQGNELLNAAKYDEALAKFTRATELAPDNAMAWADRGIALVWKDSSADAEAAFARAEALDPRNFVVFNGRGLSAERKRDFAAAIAGYTRAIELDPSNQFALAHRAAMQLGAQKPELALADAAAALKLNPRAANMYALRSYILSRQGRRDEAVAEVEAMLAALPGDPTALGIAGQVYNELGMTEQSQAIVERAVGANPTALTYYTRSHARPQADIDGRLADLGEALRLDPNYRPALMDRASLLSGNRQYEAALADADALLKLDPKLTDAYLLRANIYRGMGRREDAIAQAKALVAVNPDEAWARVTAGKIYGYFDMRTEALAEIDRALAMKPEAYLYVNRSQVRLATDWDARMGDVEAALQLSPDDSTALYEKADILQEKGEFAAAAEVYARLIEHEQPSPDLFNNRGLALARAGHAAEAETDFAKARELAVDAPTLNNICYSKAVMDVALERALEECEESLRLLPRYAGTLDSRGTVLLRLGRFDEATRDFDAALEQSPTLSTSLYLRAVARSKTGDAAGAQADRARARELNPALEEWMARRNFAIPAEPETGS